MLLAVFSALCYGEVMRVANSHVAPLLTRVLSYFSYVLIQVSIRARCNLHLFGSWRFLDKLRIYMHDQKLDKPSILRALEQATAQLGPRTVLQGPLISSLVRDLNSGP